jgi:4-amino-4-deoxy-L-arabinose transferase-like glycosyltransferase
MFRKYPPWLLTITWVAFGVRLYNLTYHSLWFDEAISVYWARQAIPRILEVGFTLVEDRLPPLYYLLLKSWTAGAGFSESGLRLLSVLLGVLLIPVITRVALILFNQRVALMAALLASINPFLIWYAQEARMYAQAALFSSLTVWAFLRLCRHWATLEATPHASTNKTRLNFWLNHTLFVLFALASLYSHLYAGFILPALGLWLIISYPRHWRLWLAYLISGLVIGLAFAPLALAIWRFSGEATPGDPLGGLGRRAWWLLQAFTVWKAPLSPLLQIVIPSAYLLLMLLAYLKPAPSSSAPPIVPAALRPTAAYPHPRLLVTLLLVVPFAIATLLLSRNYLAFFGERYFIGMLPWLLILVSIGAERISESANQRISKWAIRRLCPIGYSPFAILLCLTLLALPGQWSVPAAKEAWRQSVAFLAERAAPDHAILIHPDWVRYPFQFYFQGPGQTYAAFSTITSETPLDGPLQGVVHNHPVIWLVQSHLDGPDPNRRVEQWLAARFPLITEAYPPGISLKGYAPGYQLDTLPPQATPTAIQFKNGLRLLGYETAPTVSASDELFHPPSGWASVTLYWTISRPPTENVKPFINLVGPEGVWGASLERSNDALDFFPPTHWSPGQIIRHDVDVNLNPATPPGQYQLVVGFPGPGQEQANLTQIEVRP